MVQSKRIVRALKEALKARRISYGQVAQHLGLSLSSVKRLFSAGSFSLARLEEVCNLAGIDLLDLARVADENRLRVSSLTAEQERQLVSDPALLLTAVCVFNRSTYERILRNYRFSEVQLTKLLVRLDRMGLIELLPDNRIRRRIARNFAWLPGGPIHRYFVERVQGEFLSGAFDPDRDAQRFAWGMVSEQSATAVAGEGRRNHGRVRRSDPVRRSARRRERARYLSARGVSPMGACRIRDHATTERLMGGEKLAAMIVAVRQLGGLRDPDDEVYLATAVAGGEALITGNRRDCTKARIRPQKLTMTVPYVEVSGVTRQTATPSA